MENYEITDKINELKREKFKYKSLTILDTIIASATGITAIAAFMENEPLFGTICATASATYAYFINKHGKNADNYSRRIRELERQLS